MPAKKKPKTRRKAASSCTGSKVRDHFNTRCQIEKRRKKRKEARS